jgi:hypothetical protein
MVNWERIDLNGPPRMCIDRGALVLTCPLKGEVQAVATAPLTSANSPTNKCQF